MGKCEESLGMRLGMCGESLGMRLVVGGESLGTRLCSCVWREPGNEASCVWGEPGVRLYTLECVCIGCRTIPMLDIKSVILHVPVKRTLAHFHKYC